MRSLLRLASRAVLTALVLPSTLLSQPAATSPPARDSLPFRPRQWGAEFEVRDAASASALRFHAPTQAWIATLSGELFRASGDRRDERRVRAELLVGNRWYRSAGRAIAPFWGVGIGAAFVSDRREVQIGTGNAPPAVVDDERLVGLTYWEVGAQWLVTPRLALGAAWRVQASIERNRAERISASPPFDPPGTTVRFGAQPMALRGTLYF